MEKRRCRGAAWGGGKSGATKPQLVGSPHQRPVRKQTLTPHNNAPESRQERTQTARNACWPGSLQTLETPPRSGNLILRYSLRDNRDEEVLRAERVLHIAPKCLRPTEPSRASTRAPCRARSARKPVQTRTVRDGKISPAGSARRGWEGMQQRLEAVVVPMKSLVTASVLPLGDVSNAVGLHSWLLPLRQHVCGDVLRL